MLADEEATRHRIDKQIAEETRWLREGLTARRKRNMGRVRTLLGMRRARAERTKRTGLVTLSVGDAETGGQLVIEANHISKSYTQPGGGRKVIAQDFSTIIKRGDRIGLVGANGAGKTTLLKMLIDQEKPDKGRVRVGFGVKRFISTSTGKHWTAKQPFGRRCAPVAAIRFSCMASRSMSSPTFATSCSRNVRPVLR